MRVEHGLEKSGW